MATIAGFTAIAAACAPDVALVDHGAPDASPVEAVEPDTAAPLRLQGERLLDAEGREVLLRGMNSVTKGAPFVSVDEPGSLGAPEREYLRRSGLNSVRLGVTAAAIMPEPGRIDDTYLDLVVDTVDALAADGFWIQLDLHQDVFNQMPDWATPPSAAALSDDAPELFSFIGWAAGYLSPRSIAQWDSFLAGEPHVGGRSVASVLGDALAALAVRAADEPHVIGIELLNEPFSGSDVARCVLEGCPGLEAGLLVERYEEMAAPIRAAAPELPIWVEPFAPTGYVAPPDLAPLDIPDAPDGPQVGVAWHLYCHDTDGGRPERADDVTAAFCAERMRNGFDAGARLSAQVAGPRVLNEFGASNNPLDATLVTRLADEQFVSWMYWHQPRVEGPTESSLPDVVESQIVRPSPQATAGTPGRLAYDPASGAFTYSWTADRSIDAPTSIVVPERAYPDGYDAMVTNGVVTSPAQSGRLTVVPRAGTDDDRVTVELRRR